MKKYVKCRLVESAPVKKPNEECSQAVALRHGRTPAPARPFDTTGDTAEPAPVCTVLTRLIDQAYGIRTGRAVDCGTALNIAV